MDAQEKRNGHKPKKIPLVERPNNAEKGIIKCHIVSISRKCNCCEDKHQINIDAVNNVAKNTKLLSRFVFYFFDTNVNCLSLNKYTGIILESKALLISIK